MQNTYHPSLPFCYFTIRVSAETLRLSTLRINGLVENPGKLGEHQRNRRLTLGLTQEQVATQLGTLREVYERWERDERKPVVSVWPMILKFLGYYPGRQESLADLTLMARRKLGLEQKKLAKRMGVIHQRLRRWEHSREVPSPTECSRLRTLLSEIP